MQQLKDEKNVNNFKEKDKKLQNNENEEKQMLLKNNPAFLNCLTELKGKTLNIIKLSQQMKNEYEFICKNYPNLSDIILYYQKSFFFLQYIAETEIINNLELSRHYILRRINIILEAINNLENNKQLDEDKIKEINNLKENVKNLYLCFEKNNSDFKEKTNKFLEALNAIPFLCSHKDNK